MAAANTTIAEAFAGFKSTKQHPANKIATTLLLNNHEHRTIKLPKA